MLNDNNQMVIDQLFDDNFGNILKDSLYVLLVLHVKHDQVQLKNEIVEKELRN
jgi:hypothetical protein